MAATRIQIDSQIQRLRDRQTDRHAETNISHQLVYKCMRMQGWCGVNV